MKIGKRDHDDVKLERINTAAEVTLFFSPLRSSSSISLMSGDATIGVSTERRRKRPFKKDSHRLVSV